MSQSQIMSWLFLILPQSTSKYPEQTHLQQLQILDALNQTHGLRGLQDYLEQINLHDDKIVLNWISTFKTSQHINYLKEFLSTDRHNRLKHT